VIEVYWSVQNADLVQVRHDGAPVGEPDRATDGCCPLWLHGLDVGTYEFQLFAGAVSDDDVAWAEDAKVSLTLTLTPSIAVTAFSGDPEPDEDGKDHPPQDLQLATGTKVKLHFTAVGAKQVQITSTPDGGSAATLDPVDLDGDGKGTQVVDPADQLTLFTAVALNGDSKSEPAGPVTVHFHPPEQTVSALVTLSSGGYASLSLLDASGAPPAGGQLRLGVGNGLQIQWMAAGVSGARLSAKPLVEKPAASAEPPASSSHVSNDQLAAGIDLPLSDQGAGEGVVVVDPGPATTTEYTLAITPEQGADPVVAATATAYVANFNAQLKLPGGEVFANKQCVLEVPNQDPVKGTTNGFGELWLWLPNTSAETAVLRVLDGDQEIAAWDLALAIEDGVAEGTAAVGVSDPPAS
jgi:hypothetical protein